MKLQPDLRLLPVILLLHSASSVLRLQVRINTFAFCEAESHSVPRLARNSPLVQADLKVTIPLLQSSECWIPDVRFHTWLDR